MRIEFGATVEIDGEDVDVTVTADVEQPVAPTIRVDPDDCDPGDPGSFDVLSVVRDDTGEDIVKIVQHLRRFREGGFTQADYDARAAYEDAMEARAEAARERGWERDHG